MYTFFIAVVALVLGYIFYGKFIEKSFKIDETKKTPAYEFEDGVDYVPMPLYKTFLIQFLNIAGTGPVFGAIAGALWGPWAFVWIVFGCIFAGATHDFWVGMMSLRSKGKSMSELTGENLGKFPKQFTRVFSIVLLLLVGVVFVMGPSDILADLTKIPSWIFVVVIIIYYIVATVLPIDKLIGKIYPFFGIALIVMCIGVISTLLYGNITGQFTIPEFSFSNPHPTGMSIFPYVCISIACGAISGFHATQTPMMARCLTNEKEARKVFYGAMITEGVVALIWAAAAMTFFGSLQGLLDAGSAAVVVNKVSMGLMGQVGGILAIIGVVALPISSGDTAFRSARLNLADIFNLPQKVIKNRFIFAIPLFAIAIVLTFVDFAIIWRYFAWANQTLATIALWTAVAYLYKNNKNYIIALIPAAFMTVVITTYILIAPEGLGFIWGSLEANTVVMIGTIIGIITAVIAVVSFYMFKSKLK